MASAATVTPAPAPVMGNKFQEQRVRFHEHVGGQMRMVIIPDSLSLKEVRENATHYLRDFGREFLPQSFIVAVNDSNTVMGFWFVRMVTIGVGGTLLHMDVLPMYEMKTGEIAPDVDVPGADFVHAFDSLHGFCVKNVKTGSVKFSGLRSRDEAMSLSAEANRNIARAGR